MSQRPGMRYFPLPSITVASEGTSTASVSPIAAMRSLLM
jgi:hypothetical protein